MSGQRSEWTTLTGRAKVQRRSPGNGAKNTHRDFLCIQDVPSTNFERASTNLGRAAGRDLPHCVTSPCDLTRGNNAGRAKVQCGAPASGAWLLSLRLGGAPHLLLLEVLPIFLVSGATHIVLLEVLPTFSRWRCYLSSLVGGATTFSCRRCYPHSRV